MDRHTPKINVDFVAFIANPKDLINVIKETNVIFRYMSATHEQEEERS